MSEHNSFLMPQREEYPCYIKSQALRTNILSMFRNINCFINVLGHLETFILVWVERNLQSTTHLKGFQSLLTTVVRIGLDGELWFGRHRGRQNPGVVVVLVEEPLRRGRYTRAESDRIPCYSIDPSLHRQTLTPKTSGDSSCCHEGGCERLGDCSRRHVVSIFNAILYLGRV